MYVLIANIWPFCTRFLQMNKVHVARTGVTGGMSASVAQMALAASGVISPTTSAVLQECVDLVTVVNAARAL